MNEAEYTEALSELFRSIAELEDPELLQSVVQASTDGRSGRIRMLRALQALQREYDTRATRAELVLSRLNEVVRTESGDEVEGISIVLDEDTKTPRARSIDVTGEARQLAQVVELLSELMNDVEADVDAQ